MREGWEYKKLGEICDIICGQDYKNVQDENGIYPIYGTGGIMGYASEYKCPANTVIIGRKGNINNPLFVEEPFWNVDTAFGVVPNQESLEPKYFFYFCKNYDFSRHDVSVTIPSLRRTDIIKIEVPVPPLPEQQRIVSELDLLSSLIDKQKAQLKELDKLAQSIFYDMFGDPVENEKGWEVEPLSKFGFFLTGNTPSRSNASYYDSNDIEWIKTDNIIDSEMYPSQAAEYLSFAGLKVGRKIKRGSLLVACIAGSISSIGKCCITNKDVSFNQQISGIEPYNDKVDIYFLYSMISNTKQYLQAFATSGMKHILTKSVFQQIKLPLPPLPLQQLFAEKIQAIESQKASITQSIAETQKLFDYTMDKYFG